MTDLSGDSDAESRAAIGDANARRAISIDEAARDAMHSHAAGTTSVEIGGVLVGDVDPKTGDVFVTAAIPALRATSAVASLTFTHEAWDDVNEIMARDYEGRRMVGWYHSHPRFGIFLSEYDVFIQKNFFREEWQIAYVVDPVAGISGVFGWERGEIVRYPSWNIVAHGASKSVREPDRGGSTGAGFGPSTGPPVAVNLEDDGTPQSPTPPPAKNRLIFGALAVFVLALVTIGVLLAIGSGGGNPGKAAAKSRNRPTTTVPSNSSKGLAGPGNSQGVDLQHTSGVAPVDGSDDAMGLSERWRWISVGGPGADDLFVATISLLPAAGDSLSGTVLRCAPVGAISVSLLTPASNCDLNSPSEGALVPGSSELFVFVSSDVLSDTNSPTPSYVVAGDAPASESQASAVLHFSHQTSLPVTTATSTTIPASKKINP